MNVLPSLFCRILWKYSYSGVSQWVFGKVPIRIIAPKLVWTLEVRFLIHFMLINTENIRFNIIDIVQNIVVIHPRTHTIDVPWWYEKLCWSLSITISPSMQACFNFLVFDIKMLWIKDLVMASFWFLFVFLGFLLGKLALFWWLDFFNFICVSFNDALFLLQFWKDFLSLNW